MTISKDSPYLQPLPLRLLYSLYGKLPWPILSMAILVSASVILLCWLTGMFSQQELDFSNRTQRMGMIITLTCVTTYVLSVLPYIQSVNEESIGKIRPLVEENSHTEHYLRLLNRPGRISLLIATVLGLYWALFENLPLGLFSFQYGSSTFLLEIGYVLIQSIMWVSIAIALTVRIHWSVYLFRLGNFSSIDLFHLERLAPFARSGLRDVLFVMGALVFMPLQELDGNPVLSDYTNGLIVGIPAAIIIMWQSVYSVHRQIVKTKRQRLNELDLALSEASVAIDTENLNKLNALLSHKEHVHRLSSWPMNVAGISRLGLYLIIPPLAWLGAAFVEVALDSYLQ